MLSFYAANTSRGVGKTYSTVLRLRGGLYKTMCWQRKNVVLCFAGAQCYSADALFSEHNIQRTHYLAKIEWPP